MCVCVCVVCVCVENREERMKKVREETIMCQLKGLKKRGGQKKRLVVLSHPAPLPLQPPTSLSHRRKLIVGTVGYSGSSSSSSGSDCW